MASNLQAIGTLSYNGFVFSQYAQTLAFSQKPVVDESGRSIKYVEFDLTVKDLIIGQPTDGQVSAARNSLLRFGGRLLFQARGMGGININTGGTLDVEWGPKTEEVSFKYIAGVNACEIVWRATWRVPDCSGAAFAGQIMEFCYKLDFDKDRLGFTTLTYSGYLQIPLTRFFGPNDRQLHDSADAYLERIVPTTPYGFRRIPGRASLNYAKTRLDFSIVDEEIQSDNFLPPGIVDAHASYSQASQPPGLVRWSATLNATYTVARGFNRGIVVDEFAKLVAEKWAITRQGLLNPAGGGGVNIPGNQLKADLSGLVFLSFSASEPDIYGPPVSTLSATWTYAASLDQFFSASGLWVRLSQSDWNKWIYSMTNTLGPRGRAGLVFNVNDDKLVDLCDPTVAIPGPRPKPRTLSSVIPDVLVTDCPSPENSWVSYSNNVRVEKDSGGVVLRKLPQTPPNPVVTVGGGTTGFFIDINPPPLTTPFVGQSSGKLDPVFQQRTGETAYVYLEGEAFRACYPIPQPTLTDDDGTEFQQDNRLDKGEGFSQGLFTNVGHPLYYGHWRLRYLVPKTFLAKMPIPDNPFYQGDQ